MIIGLNTENQTFRKIMGNGLKYQVPKFQRDYAWDEEQWEDLWQDLEGLDSGEQHYMGYLVFQSGDSRNFSVIDGQQRLTTVSILILSVLYKISELISLGNNSAANKKRLETLKNTFIGFTDPVSLTTQPKLTLNRNNDTYFRNYLCGLKPAPTRRVKASERLMGNALEYFSKKLDEEKLEDGESLASFVEKLIDNLLFTTITVGSDLNAYKVFETLNARGVQLSTPDLIKNYMFSIIDNEQVLHEDEDRRLEETWEEITGQLGKNDFTRFVQSEWNSRNSVVHKSRLFKQIKLGVSNREGAFDYLERLRRSAEVYAALQDADDEFWRRDEFKEAKRPLATLNMFNILQPHGLLLSAYRKFDPEKFCKIIKYVEVISIRYNIVGNRPSNEQERVYNQAARSIADGNCSNLQDVKELLRGLYPEDSDFRADFVHKHVRTQRSPKKARFLLARIEQHISDGMEFDDSKLTLEHVLPRNPNAIWGVNFSDGELDDSIELLGNMTLLQASTNKQLGNSSFEDKKTVYKASTLAITRKCAEYDEWTRDAIDDRQQWLAGHAAKCWRIEF